MIEAKNIEADVVLTLDEIDLILSSLPQGCICDKCTKSFYSVTTKLKYIQDKLQRLLDDDIRRNGES